MSLPDGLSLSAIRRLKVDQLRAIYFEMTGQNVSSPAAKAVLIDEITSFLRARGHRAAEASRRSAEASDAKMRRAWREENDRVREANNAIFADLPWPPLAGEDVAQEGHEARVRSQIGGA